MPPHVRQSLLGLALGDAFGERFFTDDVTIERRLASRELERPAPWRWTDDTAMALALVDTLTVHGGFHADDFAARLATRYTQEPWRGYGAGAHDLLLALAAGADWRVIAPALFDGSGSFGNGAAMRVAPLGAFYAADLDACAAAADASAQVTHAHVEGRAGAIAVAVAAAAFVRTRNAAPGDVIEAVYTAVLRHTPPSAVREGIAQARSIPPDTDSIVASGQLGNGSRISAPDTVPFCIWSATARPRDLVDALWATVAARGDRDTTCAIVGGIIAAQHATTDALPRHLLGHVEPLSGIPLSDRFPVG